MWNKGGVVLKKLCLPLLALCLLVLSCFPASAHPGATDANGGHTNRKTGEYHYHHGYPEHQHYDMDGDGKPDCPYDFEDKTGQSSGSSSGSRSSSYSIVSSSDSSSRVTPFHTLPTTEPTTVPVVSKQSTAAAVSQSDSTSGVLSTIFCISLFLISSFAFFIYRGVRNSPVVDLHASSPRKLQPQNEFVPPENKILDLLNQIDSLKKELCLVQEQLKKSDEEHQLALQANLENCDYELDEQKNRHRLEMVEVEDQAKLLRSALQNRLGPDYLFILAGAPPRAFLDAEGKPHIPASFSYGDSCLFQLGPTRYHKHNCSCILGGQTVNALDLQDINLPPCNRCNPVLPDLEWYFRYTQLLAFFDKYAPKPTGRKYYSIVLEPEDIQRAVKGLESKK